MARSIETIKQEIVAAKNADPVLAGVLSSPSKTAIWNLWAYITAVALQVHERIWDLMKADMEQVAARAVPGTTAWLHNRVRDFQYHAVLPQVVQVVNLSPVYNPVVEAYRIV